MDSTLSLQMGLANLGNTCFLNSVLQCLRLTPPMCSLFLTDRNIRKDSKKKELLEAFQTLLKDIWKDHPNIGARPTMTPRGFYNSFLHVIRENEDSWYTPGQQCCAGETIQYILESLHDAMYKRVKMEISGSPDSPEEASHIKALASWAMFFGKEYSPIVEQFYGQTQKSVRCETCHNVSETYEPWIVKELPIPGADVVGGPVPDMLQCLQSAFASETLDDYQCDNCHARRKACKTERISRLPPITILHLKRFTNNRQKVSGKVVWDLDSFRFDSVMAFRRDPFRDTRVETEYETYAVIEHHGSFNGGHYTMFGKQENAWNEYDDASVTEATPDRVVSHNSYILFLMRKNQSDAMRKECIEHIRKIRSR